MAAAVTEASPKPRQLQVARLRREEEEESWISGEELYTEGSSDDEAASHSRSPAHHPHSHSHHHHHHHPPLPPDHPKCSSVHHDSPPTTPPSAASEPAQQNDPHLTETTRRLSQMGLETMQDPAVSTADTEEVEEQEEVMLWRPKRGSIKLPHVELDPPSSSLLEQVSG